MPLQLRLSLTILLFGVLTIISVVGTFYYYERGSEIANYLQSLAGDTSSHAGLLDGMLVEKAKIVVTLGMNPALIAAIQQSNRHYEAMGARERTSAITTLNQRWMAAGPNDSLVQSYVDNVAAKVLMAHQQSFPGEYGELFLTDRYGALVGATGKLTTFAHGHKYWWQDAYAKGAGQVYYDDRGFDDSVGGYVLGIVVPIRHNDDVIGILKANFFVQKLLQVATREHGDKHHNNLMVARSGGQVIFREGTEPLTESLPNDATNVITKSMMDNVLTGSEQLNGEVPYLMTFAAVSTSLRKGTTFGGTPASVDHRQGNTNEPWYVISLQPLSDVYTAFGKRIWPIGAIGLLITFVITVGAWPLGSMMQRRLSESETRLSRAFEAAADGMALLDLNGRWLQTNKALQEITGYSEEELLQLDSHSMTHPDDREADRHAIEELLKEHLPQAIYEKRYQHRDGTYIWVEFSAALVCDAMGKPLHLVAQISDITERRRVDEELQRLATTDPLTSLFNRRRLLEALESEIKRRQRSPQPLSVLMLDIDHFKQINDRYGHHAGDTALRQLAAHCSSLLRELDAFGRLGGEEFAIILPGSTLENARIMAERLRSHVEAMRIGCGEGCEFGMTVSIGAATATEEDMEQTELLRRADRALYQAKEEGRNRVCLQR